mgnify:CR=1 FL=1
MNKKSQLHQITWYFLSLKLGTINHSRLLSIKSSLSNKKGLSQVVSVVIIILLAISSVSLVSLFVFKIINNPQFSPNTSCLSIKLDNLASVNSACYNNSSNETEIKISRKSDNDFFIDSMELILSDGKDSKTWTCSSCGSCEILGNGESKVYFVEGSGSELSLKVNGCVVDTTSVGNC